MKEFRDLRVIESKEYQDLARRTSEVKRLLTDLFQKLKADRRGLRADSSHAPKIPSVLV